MVPLKKEALDPIFYREKKTKKVKPSLILDLRRIHTYSRIGIVIARTKTQRNYAENENWWSCMRKYLIEKNRRRSLYIVISQGRPAKSNMLHRILRVWSVISRIIYSMCLGICFPWYPRKKCKPTVVFKLGLTSVRLEFQ